MVSTFLAVVALSVACLVVPSYGQAVAPTINCYQCTSTATDTMTVDGPGCAYPFNSTGLKTVACPGQCVKSIYFDADDTTHGKKDTITRGCTQTTPAVGCSSSSASPGLTVCVSVCSSDLCNSAVTVTQSAAVRLLAAFGILAIAVNFCRK